MTNMKKMNATINPGTTKAKPALVFPKVTYKPTPLERLKTWCKEHFGTEKARKATAKAVAKKVDSAINSFSRALRFNLMLALVAMLVTKFCPEIADKCPIIFQFFEGILIFYEFLFRAVFTALKAFIQLFTLNLPAAGDTLSAVFAEAGRLLTELFQWIQTITF